MEKLTHCPNRPRVKKTHTVPLDFLNKVKTHLGMYIFVRYPPFMISGGPFKVPSKSPPCLDGPPFSAQVSVSRRQVRRPLSLRRTPCLSQSLQRQMCTSRGWSVGLRVLRTLGLGSGPLQILWACLKVPWDFQAAFLPRGAAGWILRVGSLSAPPDGSKERGLSKLPSTRAQRAQQPVQAKTDWLTSIGKPSG